ncbi:hypothetical protein RDI58_030350 [Solanum bulbocastanum]|uniref:Uncharacterized protein n=1 Tax=Solanum bulbocastanum TaxID=147425 RepID=A0AAN8XY79_SOLBU
MFNRDLLAIERAPNGKPWFTDIREYIEHQTYPKHATENDKKTIRRLAMQFVARGCDSPSWGKSHPLSLKGPLGHLTSSQGSRMYGIGPPILSPLKSFMDFESGIELWLIRRYITMHSRA